MQFSILIPTLNEEKFIGKLLTALREQTFKEFEVVVMDGFSKDRTLNVVASFKDMDIKMHEAPRKGVSAQRNHAALMARYDNLVFFDADVIPEPRFLEKLAGALERKPFDVGTSWNVPLSDKWFDHFIYWVNNMYLELMKDFMPGAVGTFIYCNAKAFRAINGFDVDIAMGEDFDLVRRADAARFSYKLLRDPKINFSVRRLDKEGRLAFASKSMFRAFYYHLMGSIRRPKWFKGILNQDSGGF